MKAAGKLDCHRTPSGRVLFRRHDVLKVVTHPENSSRNGDS
jgi:hypothetical protein